MDHSPSDHPDPTANHPQHAPIGQSIGIVITAAGQDALSGDSIDRMQDHLSAISSETPITMTTDPSTCATEFRLTVTSAHVWWHVRAVANLAAGDPDWESEAQLSFHDGLLDELAVLLERQNHASWN